MDQDDPERRIAELERQLAEQKRIAELERQLAEAKAAAREHHAVDPPQFSDAQAGAGHDASDEQASRYAQGLMESLRTGGFSGLEGLSGPARAQLREALMRAGANAGMSQAQIDDALQHASVTIKTGHSVVYPGQSGPQDFGAAGPVPPPAFPAGAGFSSQAEFSRQPPRRKLFGANRFGAIAGAAGMVIGICLGGAGVLTAVFPSSALWTSVIVCGGPNQLMSNTSHYSYRPGQSGSSVSFQCVGANGSYDAGFFAIMGLQCLLIALVLCAAVPVFLLIRRLLRRPVRIWNAIIVGVLVLLVAAVLVAIPWQTLTSSGPIQMAKGGTLTVKGNGESKTVACNDGYLTVSGRDMTVTVTGHCVQLTVDGVISHVTVDSADVIAAKGVNNVVIFHSGAPQINNSGMNTVQQG